MIIRDAVFEDLEQLMPIAHEVHAGSVFAPFAMNDAQIQRVFVTMMAFDDGFVKVVERNDKIVGCLAGAVAENHFGIRCAQDFFNYSMGGTHRLLREFKSWAKEHGAQFIQISDFGGKKRYHKLIIGEGFKPEGINFIGV